MAAVLAMEQKYQGVTDHQNFAEGQPHVLALAYTESLSNPFNKDFVSSNDRSNRASLFGLLSLLRFLSHTYMTSAPPKMPNLIDD